MRKLLGRMVGTLLAVVIVLTESFFTKLFTLLNILVKLARPYYDIARRFLRPIVGQFV